MAVYRIGEILRMKREALGITREKLCEMSEEVCSPQTLYRMECGKVKVKQEVYRKLMECMGELPERNYASIMVSKYQALNLKSKIDVHLVHREYEEAEKKLEELKLFVDVNYVRNKQYILETEKFIQYYKQQILVEEYLENLWIALRYTIPNMDKIEFDKWPLNYEEFGILVSISSIFHEIKCRENELDLLLKLKENTEKKYMEENCYVSWHTICLIAISQIMCMTNQHEKAMEYCKIGIDEIKKQRILGNIEKLLYNMAWSKEQLIKKEMLEKKEREFCKKLLVQAYYLSKAQNMENSAERIKELYNRYYPENIKMLL